MKKTLLWGSLMALFFSPTYAEDANPAQPQNAPSAPAAAAQESLPNSSQPSMETQQPATETPQNTNDPQARGATEPQNPPQNPTNNRAPTEQQTSTPPATETPQNINCNYRILATTTQIDQDIIRSWAEQAAVQSFNMDHNTIDQQMNKLKNCFTDQGWKGFSEALEKSGNVAAIKDQNLTVSSQTDGAVEIIESQENHWKVNLPLQVVYQNDKEKLTQLLTIQLIIGRKTSGDLGIMQFIAMPRQPGSTTIEGGAAPNKNQETPQP